MESGGSTDMTLAFDLSAMQRLADPGAAVENAKTWSEYIGVVSNEPTYVVTNFTRKHRIQQDFFSGPRDKRETMAELKTQFDTERHVYVSNDQEEQELAEEFDWEFLHVEDAAEAAGWELTEIEEDTERIGEEVRREDWP